MYKLHIFITIFLVQFIRIFILSLSKKNPRFIFVSLFIICVPFQFAIPIYDPGLSTMSGTLGNKIYFLFPLILSIIFIPFIKYRKVNIYKNKQNGWIWGLSLLIVISIFYTSSNSIIGTVVFTNFIFSHIIFFFLIFYSLKKKEVIMGIYEGLFFLCILQFLLALCFPLLKMDFVTTLFQATGEEGAKRMDTRSGAIGVFSHPGNLALFSICTATFFISSYLNNYKKKVSLFLLICCTITLILTYSRTAYLVYAFDLFLLVYIHRNAAKNLFTIANFFKFILPIAFFFIWLILFSPFTDLFLESDANSQIDNRMVHYLMATKLFFESPIFGVGLNSHLEYLSKKFSIINSVTLDSFFSENPIHNIHLLVLAEAGIFGLLMWFYFLISNGFKAKASYAKKENMLLSLTQLGIIVAFCTYGITGWAPFSQSILPLFLFFSFFSIKYRRAGRLRVGRL